MQSTRFRLPLFSILLGALFCFGCGTTQLPKNSRLDTWDPTGGYRFTTAAEDSSSEDLLVVLAFSGGGTRAAALAWGVLETLREAEIVRDGRKYRLIEEVDVISAVSGGSIVGAYFALHGERAFDDFPERFLENDIQGKTVRFALSPRRWKNLGSGRIDLLSEVLDREVFGGSTFSDLEGRRPFLLINSTDITQGLSFPFTQTRFDRLCSNLSDFSIARATAASAAVPLLFRPSKIKSYGHDCGYTEEPWVAEALVGDHLERRRQAAVVSRDAARPWVYLLDGAVADNLGLLTLYDFLFSPDELSCKATPKMPKDVILIAVDAGTGLDPKADFREDGPGLRNIMWAVMNVAVDRLAERALDQMEDRLVDWACSRSVCDPNLPECPSYPPADEPIPGLRLYPISVSLQNVLDPQKRNALKKIPTTFSLDKATVDRLRETGRELLEASPEYQRLIREETP